MTPIYDLRKKGAGIQVPISGGLRVEHRSVN